MSDDDFRDLLYVVRAIRRTYEHDYGSFRHSVELDTANKLFDRLWERYVHEDGHIYPQDEPDLIAKLGLMRTP